MSERTKPDVLDICSAIVILTLAVTVMVQAIRISDLRSELSTLRETIEAIAQPDSAATTGERKGNP